MISQPQLSILFFALAFGFQSLGQTVTPGILKVSITDQNNNPVPNYDVLIRPNASNLTDEIIVSTNNNGYWSDTVGLYEDASDPGYWFFSIFVLDSTSGGIGRIAISHGGPIQSAYWVSDTFKFQLTNAIKAEDNCGSYQVRVDSAINDPMFIYFRNDLNRLKLGTTWVYGDGDTGHAPQSGHRYKVPGKYYFCHYTDSCGPVCDSVMVPLSGKGIGIIEPNLVSDFEIYPNPANNRLTIKSNEEEVQKVEIFDLSGNILFRAINYGDRHIQNINLEQIKSGVYLISVHSEKGQTKTYKLVKN